MTIAANNTASQAYSDAAVVSDVTNSASQVYALVAGAYPSQDHRVMQAYSVVATVSDTVNTASQVYSLVAARGSVTDPSVRVWTFTLDGHDFYILRLGNDKTFVFDALSGQWYIWGGGDSLLWNTYSGCAWQGASRISGVYGSNIVVGDDANGSIYFLDPDKTDDDASVDGISPVPFKREAYTQLAFTGYERKRCFGVTLYGSTGYTSAAEDQTVTLEYSDNRGVDFTSTTSLNTVPEEYNERLHWRSLGSMLAPGRIFRVTDYGALKRLDSMEMEDGS